MFQSTSSLLISCKSGSAFRSAEILLSVLCILQDFGLDFQWSLSKTTEDIMLDTSIPAVQVVDDGSV